MNAEFNLLVVDDDPGQVRLIRALLGHLGLSHRCHCALNGHSALDFLNKKPPFEHAPRPNLVLLDLNMPGMNGCDVLRYVKSDPELRSIPVIVLSTSQAAQDVNACYSEHANAYVYKGPDLESNLNLLRDIDRFWGAAAVLPG